MKLTDEFESAKAGVVRQEQTLNKIFDGALNKNRLDRGGVSDIYLHNHLQSAADLYMRIYDQLDYLYNVPVTTASKSYIELHAKNLKEVHQELLEEVYKLEDNTNKELLDDEHKIAVAKILIGVSKLIENHEKLIIDFANMVKDNPEFQRKKRPPSPS